MVVAATSNPNMCGHCERLLEDDWAKIKKHGTQMVTADDNKRSILITDPVSRWN